VGPSPGGSSDLESERRYALTGGLEDLLGTLLDDIRRRTPFERLVGIAGARSYLVARAVGVPREEVRSFVRAVLREGPLDVLGQRTVPVGFSEAALQTLGSLRAAVAVPATSTPGGPLAIVVVEADPDHPDLREVRESLDLASPALSRLAELESLRHRVEELELHQRRSRSALGALPDPVLVMDEESRILLANRRAEELLVSGPDDSRGRRHAVETNNLFFSAFRARTILERDRPAAPRELLLVDPTDGSDLLFEVAHVPFDTSAADAGNAIFVLRDITDLKQATHELEVQFTRSIAAEHEARRESERLNVMIENAGIPIFVTDPQANVILMNREAERLLETSAVRASPRLHDIRDNDAKLAGFINEFMLQKRLRREERMTLVDPDEARDVPMLAVSTKILNDHYEPTAVVTVLRDLTQEVQNQHLAQELRRLNTELEVRVQAATRELEERNAQLEKQSTQLERASRMKTEFLATMSHELRTPINAVLGYNSLLREGLFGEPTPRQQDALERMRNAAQHLLTLINDILDLTRVEAGQLHVVASDIELPAFLEGLSEAVRPTASEKSLDYSIAIDPAVPMIRTDETRLRQVLLNLLSNAVKFTEEGSVTLTVRVGMSPDHVLFEVVDTGPGIHAADLETIFEEFTQADQSATRKHGGAGLGLAISRKLIRIMGGTLDVSSTIGSGSSFRVELPTTPPPSWPRDESSASRAPLTRDPAATL
jgi:PAS domain S-box-containing protein